MKEGVRRTQDEQSKAPLTRAGGKDGRAPSRGPEPLLEAGKGGRMDSLLEPPERKVAVLATWFQTIEIHF